MTTVVKSVKAILNTDIKTLNPLDFKIEGIYGDKCTVCKSDYRSIIDFLLKNGASIRQVHAYCNTYNAFDQSYSKGVIEAHRKNHTLVETDAVVTPGTIEAKESAGMKIVRDMDLKGRLNEIEVTAFAPYISGKKTPTMKEGLQAAQLRKDLVKEERTSQFIKNFFGAADKKPLKDPKRKSKITVSSEKGVEVSQEISE